MRGANETPAQKRLRESHADLLAVLRAICESAGPAGIKHDSAASVIATALIEEARAAIVRAESQSRPACNGSATVKS